VTNLVNINKIKNLAKLQGIKISFLCSQINKAHTFFSDAQRGKTTLSPDNLAVIADLLHTTPEYLMDETDDPAPIKKESLQTEELSPDVKELIDLVKSINDPATIHAIKMLLLEIKNKK
jgi:transcriptional regulator with XRE-family HTH domain